METVNALKIRNNLGEILDRLNNTGQPIIVSKGRKVRAVLVTPEDFNRRFLDVQVREEKQKRLRAIKSLREKKMNAMDSTLLLRQLRGYIQ